MSRLRYSSGERPCRSSTCHRGGPEQRRRLDLLRDGTTRRLRHNPGERLGRSSTCAREKPERRRCLALLLGGTTSQPRHSLGAHLRRCNTFPQGDTERRRCLDLLRDERARCRPGRRLGPVRLLRAHRCVTGCRFLQSLHSCLCRTPVRRRRRSCRSPQEK